MTYSRQVQVELALLDTCIGVHMSGYLQLALLSIKSGCVGRQPGALIRQLCRGGLQRGLLVGQLLQAPLLLLPAGKRCTAFMLTVSALSTHGLLLPAGWEQCGRKHTQEHALITKMQTRVDRCKMLQILTGTRCAACRAVQSPPPHAWHAPPQQLSPLPTRRPGPARVRPPPLWQPPPVVHGARSSQV